MASIEQGVASAQAAPRESDLALVLSGGGARAAYQVGFLRHVARIHPDLRLDIVTGVSAGAINAAYLACHEGTFSEKVRDLAAVWAGLTMGHVFDVDTASLATSVLRWGLRLVSGGAPTAPPTRGFVNTRPLWRMLEAANGAVDGHLLGIDANVRAGRLKAVAITGVSYSTGQSITWFQGGHMEPWERPQRKSVRCNITVAHVMASASLPLFFPAVKVDGRWYGDGGIRLAAPFAPALHLGARRIIAISTRYPRSSSEAEQPDVTGYPPPAQVLGVLMNAIFLDLVDQDAVRLDKINRVIRGMSEEQRMGLREVKLLVLRPSRDLGKMANEHEVNLPRSFRFLTRGLGTRETSSNDLLSLLMFQRDYIARLVELGAADAEAHRDEIDRFLADGA